MYGPREKRSASQSRVVNAGLCFSSANSTRTIPSENAGFDQYEGPPPPPPSVTSTVFSTPSRSRSTSTFSPGFRARMSRESALKSRNSSPPNRRRRSPLRSPARAAGPSAVTSPSTTPPSSVEEGVPIPSTARRPWDAADALRSIDFASAGPLWRAGSISS